jgi:hypothetical protein
MASAANAESLVGRTSVIDADTIKIQASESGSWTLTRLRAA